MTNGHFLEDYCKIIVWIVMVTLQVNADEDRSYQHVYDYINDP